MLSNVLTILLSITIALAIDELSNKHAAIHWTVFEVDGRGYSTPRQWALEYGLSKAALHKGCARVATYLQHRKLSDPDTKAYNAAMDETGNHRDAVTANCEDTMGVMMAALDRPGDSHARRTADDPEHSQAREFVEGKLLAKGAEGRSASQCTKHSELGFGGACLLHHGRIQQAVSHLGGVIAPYEDKSKTADPDELGDPSHAFLFMGIALERSGNHDSAAKAYMKATKLCLLYASERWLTIAGSADEHMVRTRTIPGVLLATLDPKKDSDVSLVLHQEGFWDMRTLELIRQGMFQGQHGMQGLLLDVGAHVGFFAVYTAAMGYQVHAFEAVPEHAARIRRSMSLNGEELANRLTLHENIVADKHNGTMTISPFKIGPAGSAFVSEGKPASRDAGVEVRTLRIADVISSPISVMKIDVEGCELQVLLSSLKLIAAGRVESLLIEVCPYLWSRCSTSVIDAERVFGEMLQRGLRLYVYDGDSEMFKFADKVGLPKLPYPGQDFDVYELPSKIAALMKLLQEQKEGGFCQHMLATHTDVAEAQRQQQKQYQEL